MKKIENITEWLLESDPSIRWQVMKDILLYDEKIYNGEKEKISENGWGSSLLKLQDNQGLWNKSLYNGKWLSTTYTLQLLKIFGLNPANKQAGIGCNRLITEGLYLDREIRFSKSKNQKDIGVTGLVLSICSYFNYDINVLKNIVRFLILEQNPNGNWLPYDSKGAELYTFETTLLVLEALYQFMRNYPGEYLNLVSGAIEKGQEYLLSHNLFLKDNTPVKKQWLTFSFPQYWFYDILTVLDYFRLFTRHDNRMEPAVNIVKNKIDKSGFVELGAHHPGKVYFTMEKPGEASKWNTLRALRVLKWWNNRS